LYCLAPVSRPAKTQARPPPNLPAVTTRLQDMIGLTPGNLIIHLRKLEEADYISSSKTSNGTVSITTVALTGHGRKALGTYTQALRDLLGGL
jgi:DNA-binding MarR family transcriptional regulator